MGLSITRRTGEAVDVFVSGEQRRLKVIYNDASFVIVEYAGKTAHMMRNRIEDFGDFTMQFYSAKRSGSVLHFNAPPQVQILRTELLGRKQHGTKDAVRRRADDLPHRHEDQKDVPAPLSRDISNQPEQGVFNNGTSGARVERATDSQATVHDLAPGAGGYEAVPADTEVMGHTQGVQQR